MDGFTLQRLRKFVFDHRTRTGQLATLSDLETAGFSKTDVEVAKKKKIVKELYVTMTTGAVVKGYKAVE